MVTKTKAGRSDMHKSQHTALELFLTGSFSQKQIAETIGVSERTISTWAAKFQWDEQMALRSQAPQELENDLLQVIAGIVKERKNAEFATDRIRLADELSKYNKTLDSVRKESRLSLTAHCQIMKDLLAFVQVRMPDLMPRLMDMQQQYITTKSQEYL